MSPIDDLRAQLARLTIAVAVVADDVADTQYRLASTLERLARTGRPDHAGRRLRLAAEARARAGKASDSASRSGSAAPGPPGRQRSGSSHRENGPRFSDG